MGISDRHYLRDEPYSSAPLGAGVGRRLRAFSVNTWIIVACVAIFVIDGFLPLRYVPTGRYALKPEFSQIDPDRLKLGDREYRSEVPRVDPISQRGYREVSVRRSLIDRDTGQEVGVAETRPMRMIESWLYFSTNRLLHGIEYWRVIGFQFLHDHSSWAHLAFNMIGLYFFGPLVERRLGGKRYLAFYLLCGICGALTYLLLNVLGIAANSLFPDVHIPFLLFNDPETPLIGASAGVFGVLMAGAFIAPNETVLLFFVIPMRFATLAYGLVALSLLTLAFSWNNAGGEAAHLGGAAAGWYLIRRPHHLHGFFDILGRVDPTSRSNRARRMAKKARAAPPDATAVEVDRILDKIRTQGMASLTEAERRVLRAASGR